MKFEAGLVFSYVVIVGSRRSATGIKMKCVFLLVFVHFSSLEAKAIEKRDVLGQQYAAAPARTIPYQSPSTLENNYDHPQFVVNHKKSDMIDNFRRILGEAKDRMKVLREGMETKENCQEQQNYPPPPRPYKQTAEHQYMAEEGYQQDAAKADYGHANYETGGHAHANYETGSHAHGNYETAGHGYEKPHANYETGNHAHANYETSNHAHVNYEKPTQVHSYNAVYEKPTPIYHPKPSYQQKPDPYHHKPAHQPVYNKKMVHSQPFYGYKPKPVATIHYIQEHSDESYSGMDSGEYSGENYSAAYARKAGMSQDQVGDAKKEEHVQGGAVVEHAGKITHVEQGGVKVQEGGVKTEQGTKIEEAVKVEGSTEKSVKEDQKEHVDHHDEHVDLHDKEHHHKEHHDKDHHDHSHEDDSDESDSHEHKHEKVAPKTGELNLPTSSTTPSIIVQPKELQIVGASAPVQLTEMEQLVLLREEIHNILNVVQILKDHQTQEKLTNTHTDLTTEEKSKIFQNLNFDHQNTTFKHQDLHETIKKIDLKLRVMLEKHEDLDKITQKLESHEKEIEFLNTLLEHLINSNEKETDKQTKDLKEWVEKMEKLLKEIDSQGRLRASRDFDLEDKLRQMENRISSLSETMNPREDNEGLMELMSMLMNVDKKDRSGMDQKLQALERKLEQVEDENRKTKQELRLNKMQRELETLISKTKTQDHKLVMESKTELSNADILKEIEKVKEEIVKIKDHDGEKHESRQLPEDNIQSELKKLQEKIDELNQPDSSKPQGKQEITGVDNLDNIFSIVTQKPSTNIKPASSSQVAVQTGGIGYYSASTTSRPVAFENDGSAFEENRATQPSDVKFIPLPPFKAQPTKIVYQVPFCLQPLSQSGQEGSVFGAGGSSSVSVDNRYGGVQPTNQGGVFGFGQTGGQIISGQGEGGYKTSQTNQGSLVVNQNGQGTSQGNQQGEAQGVYQGSAQGQIQGFAGASQGQVQGYAGASQGQVQGFASASQGQVQGYAGASQGQGQGYAGTSQGQGQGYAGPPQGYYPVPQSFPERALPAQGYNAPPVTYQGFPQGNAQGNAQGGVQGGPQEGTPQSYQPYSMYPTKQESYNVPKPSYRATNFPLPASETLKISDDNLEQLLTSEILKLEKTVNNLSPKSADEADENINILEELLDEFANSRKKRATGEEKNTHSAVLKRMEELKKEVDGITDPDKRAKHLAVLKTLEKELSSVEKDKAEETKKKANQERQSKLQSEVSDLKKRLRELEELGGAEIAKEFKGLEGKLDSLIETTTKKPETSTKPKGQKEKLQAELDALKEKVVTKEQEKSTTKAPQKLDKAVAKEGDGVLPEKKVSKADLLKELRELREQFKPTTTTEKVDSKAELLKELEKLRELNEELKHLAKPEVEITTEGHKHGKKDLAEKLVSRSDLLDELKELREMEDELKKLEGQGITERTTTPKSMEVNDKLENMKKQLKELKNRMQTTTKTPEGIKESKGNKAQGKQLGGIDLLQVEGGEIGQLFDQDASTSAPISSNQPTQPAGSYKYTNVVYQIPMCYHDAPATQAPYPPNCNCNEGASGGNFNNLDSTGLQNPMVQNKEYPASTGPYPGPGTLVGVNNETNPPSVPQVVQISPNISSGPYPPNSMPPNFPYDVSAMKPYPGPSSKQPAYYEPVYASPLINKYMDNIQESKDYPQGGYSKNGEASSPAQQGYPQKMEYAKPQEYSGPSNVEYPSKSPYSSNPYHPSKPSNILEYYGPKKDYGHKAPEKPLKANYAPGKIEYPSKPVNPGYAPNSYQAPAKNEYIPKPTYPSSPAKQEYAPKPAQPSYPSEKPYPTNEYQNPSKPIYSAPEKQGYPTNEYQSPVKAEYPSHEYQTPSKPVYPVPEKEYQSVKPYPTPEYQSPAKPVYPAPEKEYQSVKPYPTPEFQNPAKPVYPAPEKEYHSVKPNYPAPEYQSPPKPVYPPLEKEYQSVKPYPTPEYQSPAKPVYPAPENQGYANHEYQPIKPEYPSHEYQNPSKPVYPVPEKNYQSVKSNYPPQEYQSPAIPNHSSLEYQSPSKPVYSTHEYPSKQEYPNQEYQVPSKSVYHEKPEYSTHEYQLVMSNYPSHEYQGPAKPIYSGPEKTEYAHEYQSSAKPEYPSHEYQGPAKPAYASPEYQSPSHEYQDPSKPVYYAHEPEYPKYEPVKSDYPSHDYQSPSKPVYSHEKPDYPSHENAEKFEYPSHESYDHEEKSEYDHSKSIMYHSKPEPEQSYMPSKVLYEYAHQQMHDISTIPEHKIPQTFHGSYEPHFPTYMDEGYDSMENHAMDTYEETKPVEDSEHSYGEYDEEYVDSDMYKRSTRRKRETVDDDPGNWINEAMDILHLLRDATNVDARHATNELDKEELETNHGHNTRSQYKPTDDLKLNKARMSVMPDYVPEFHDDFASKESRTAYSSNVYAKPEYYKDDYVPIPTITIGKTDKTVHKFDKLFLKIAKFIIHKVGLLIPYLIENFFGLDVSYENGYGSSYGYSPGLNLNAVQEFKQFGLLGLIPVMIVKILTKISSLVAILQQNRFLRNFLIPAGVVLLVNGAIIFLIWWLFPLSDYNYGNNYNKYNYVGYNSGYSGGYRAANISDNVYHSVRPTYN